MIRDNNANAENERVIFLSFDNNEAPSDALLSRLSDLQREFRSGSRILNPWEVASGYKANHVVDRVTGEKGIRITIYIEQWIHDDEAEVSVSVVRGELNAHGFTCRIRKTDNYWQIVSRGMSWMS
jgi:hypothetical protein